MTATSLRSPIDASIAPIRVLARRLRCWRAGGEGRWLMARAPLGIALCEGLDEPLRESDGWWFAPAPDDVNLTVEALASRLPPPARLRPAVLVVAAVPVAQGLLTRLLGSQRPLSRAVRGSALLLAGYREIMGAVDPRSGLDLTWAE